MVTREESFEFTPEYPVGRLGCPEDILFFDIETTGFSADRDQVYMIGVLNVKGGRWHITQWLSDTVDSEGDLLDSFFSYIDSFKILISFNGDTFDIPFLLKRSRILGRNYSFDSVKSIDIYKLARPYRNILGLKNCKQKSIECFLGIDRDDCYSGGELINVYIQYLYTKDDSFAGLLLLHNADDLRGMPKILSILSYPDFFSAPLLLEDAYLKQDQEDAADLLVLRCQSDLAVPVPVRIKNDPVSCEIAENRITFNISLTRGTLKHYFPDPSEYDYLIYEDMAVHKSVGQYVDRKARRQATVSTCYVKQEGLFLPQFDEIWEPVMKTDLKDKMCYVLFDNATFEDPEKWEAYSQRLLSWLAP